MKQTLLRTACTDKGRWHHFANTFMYTVSEVLLRTQKHASLQQKTMCFEETLQCTTTPINKLYINSTFIYYSTFEYCTKIIRGYADKLITSANRYTQTHTHVNTSQGPTIWWVNKTVTHKHKASLTTISTEIT